MGVGVVYFVFFLGFRRVLPKFSFNPAWPNAISLLLFQLVQLIGCVRIIQERKWQEQPSRNGRQQQIQNIVFRHWFSTLLPRGFSRVLRFSPFPKNQH